MEVVIPYNNCRPSKPTSQDPRKGLSGFGLFLYSRPGVTSRRAIPNLRVEQSDKPPESYHPENVGTQGPLFKQRKKKRHSVIEMGTFPTKSWREETTQGVRTLCRSQPKSYTELLRCRLDFNVILNIWYFLCKLT